MLISYDQPTMTWTITGTGASFITPAAALTNGRPADATRVQLVSGSQTTSTTTVLTAAFGAAIAARCCALLMPNTPATAIPDGVKITFAGKLSGAGVALGGNALTARTVFLPNGATAIICVFPAVTIDTLVMTIYNDRNGSTWAAASQLVDLGEVWCGRGADFMLANDFSANLDGGLLKRQSHNNQAWPLEQQPYRSVTFNIQPLPEFAAIGPNPYQDDFETVMNRLSVQKSVVVIEGYEAPGYGPTTNGKPPASITTATISAQRLARTFVFGIPDQSIKIKRQPDGNYWTSTIVFGEVPP